MDVLSGLSEGVATSPWRRLTQHQVCPRRDKNVLLPLLCLEERQASGEHLCFPALT